MEPIHFQGGMCSPRKLGEVPCLEGCVAVSPVSNFNPFPPSGSASVLQCMREFRWTGCFCPLLG